MSELTQQQYAVLQRLKNDLPFYAKHCLKTKTKSGGIVPLVFNRVQLYIHAACEDQKRRKGYVRKILVKGRQQTCSTYVAARFYHQAQMVPGTNVYILSHEAKSTQNLFKKVETFNEGIVASFPMLMHGTVRENRTEMEFGNQSEYGVGTAGAENTGRGPTARCFHGSECPFWQNVQNIRTGALQTVALMRDTEVILEATCNGLNWWYPFCMDAVNGIGVYELEFIPWFWTDEYRLPIDSPSTFTLTNEEVALKEVYGLDDEQINWRRAKIVELESVRMFRQEYPCCLEEAFQASGAPFYDSEMVMAALNREPEDDYIAPLILGVDPGRKGDRTVLCWRRGRTIERVEVHKEMDSMRLAGIVSNAIDTDGIDKVFMDNAIGYGTIDRLKERGYGEFIEGVDFGQGATDAKYANKRAEMACEFNDWLKAGGAAIVASDLQQKMAIAADIGMMPEFKLTSNSRIQFPSKDELRKEYKRSPDILDAMMLLFAYPVRPRTAGAIGQTVNTKRGSALSARRRVTQSADQVSVSLDPFEELRRELGKVNDRPRSVIKRWGR